MCVVFDLWWRHGNCSNMWPLLVRIVWSASIHCVSTVKFHTHEYDYKGHNPASRAVTLYHSGVGYSPSLSIIYSWSHMELSIIMKT